MKRMVFSSDKFIVRSKTIRFVFLWLIGLLGSLSGFAQQQISESDTLFGTYYPMDETSGKYDTLNLQLIVDNASPGDSIKLKRAVIWGLFTFQPTGW